MKLLLALLLLLSFTNSSSAIYCLCKDGTGDDQLQTSIDYACGTLADCNPISINGSCYQPNTIKNHCDWSVNSYFQNSAQAPQSCNFSGTATTSQNPPSNLANGCIYPSSPSSTRSPPSLIPPPGTPPTNGTNPFPGTPPTTNGTNPFPGTPPTNGTNPFPGNQSPFTPVFGPTGLDNQSGGASSLVSSSVLTLCFSSLAFILGFCHV